MTDDEQLGVSVVYEALLSAVHRYGPRPCLGVREQEADGLWGPYRWSSYDECTSACSAWLGAPPPWRAGGRRRRPVSDNCPEWVVVEQACHAFGLVSVPLWFTVGVGYVEKLLADSGVAAGVCGERWTGALLRLAEQSKLPAVRLIVQRERLQYEELALHESLDRSDKGDGRTALKLYDLPFVEQMGERNRRPPCPPAASALATIVYRWRLDADPVGCRLTQANLVASLCALRPRRAPS